MPAYDSSDPVTQLRAYRGTRLYMASHPAIRSSFRARERPSEFGDRVWETTFRLIDFLEGAAPTRVLEIGCGWGLLGIHLARLHGAAVTCTDLDPKLAPIVRAHAALNGVEVAFKATPISALSDTELACDLLVGAEVCYCAELCVELADLARRAARAGTGRMLIADPGRPDFEDLCTACADRYDTEVLDLRRPGETKPSFLLSVRF